MEIIWRGSFGYNNIWFCIEEAQEHYIKKKIKKKELENCHSYDIASTFNFQQGRGKFDSYLCAEWCIQQGSFYFRKVLVHKFYDYLRVLMLYRRKSSQRLCNLGTYHCSFYNIHPLLLHDGSLYLHSMAEGYSKVNNNIVMRSKCPSFMTPWMQLKFILSLLGFNLHYS